jgi:hypothetical protein
MSDSYPQGEERRNPAFEVGELGELWSWGVDASRAMSERVFEMYRDLGSSAVRVLTGDVESDLRRVRLDVERLADLSVDVFDRLLGVARLVAEEKKGDLQRDDDAIALRVFAGNGASADVWVHNVTAEDRPIPRLHCTGLAAADGAHIPASRIRLDLAQTPIKAGNSRKFTFAVDVPATSPCGVYHGLLISDASTDSVTLVRVEVINSETTRMEAPDGG